MKEDEVINASAVKTIEILQSRGSYYIAFFLNAGERLVSKRFERIEECLELFNRIWSAMADDLSVDIS